MLVFMYVVIIYYYYCNNPHKFSALKNLTQIAPTLRVSNCPSVGTTLRVVNFYGFMFCV